MNFLKFTLVIFLSSALLACGGGGDSGGGLSDAVTESISVTPSLGKVSQVEIEIYSADAESLLGSALIGDEKVGLR